jgi:Fe-S-cluster containining protein
MRKKDGPVNRLFGLYRFSERLLRMLLHCIACAQKGQSCCRNVHIYLTRGDVRRIGSQCPGEDFYHLAPLTSDYEDGGGDPTWNPAILDASGRRRIVRQKDTGDCCFLTETGCRLPSDVRPLLCRIYPYDFREHGLCGISASCPVVNEIQWLHILEASEMKQSNARQWVAQLYDEIAAERRDTTTQGAA